jgi:hypothetical protein
MKQHPPNLEPGDSEGVATPAETTLERLYSFDEVLVILGIKNGRPITRYQLIAFHSQEFYTSIMQRYPFLKGWALNDLVSRRYTPYTERDIKFLLAAQSIIGATRDTIAAQQIVKLNPQRLVNLANEL